ncbi:class C sortase [Xylanimonas allomyrinae]|uniref:Class C sortase n=1 Tax=Xylanimonas allomyrinae TaxID=2509459 RepID=A0A4P6F0F0_9MICO|nr:class C sortase [Xylanimonas allomyrinae]QAY63808.1 class C sortase [Xylanimonas allomyrinae]
MQVVGTCVVAVLAALSAGLLQYHATSDWFFARSVAGVYEASARTTAGRSPAELRAALAEARAYNADLAAGRVVPESAAGRARYDAAVSHLGADSIGWVSIPAIDVSLPVYRDTTDASLSRGVGHWYGSSLPVGGEGHAVLASHSGLPEADLFTRLEDVQVGDWFSVSAAGEVLYYVVDDIRVVEPQAVDAVETVPGKDYVTLVTCTPIGVNSDRLLVRGVRGDPPAEALQDLSHVNPAPGFPWWAVIWGGATVGAAGLTWLVLMPPRRRDGTAPPQ